MWCQNCGQDIPAVYSPDLSAYCCGRCMTILPLDAMCRADRLSCTAAPTNPSKKIGITEEKTYDGWEVEHDLSHFAREIGVWQRNLLASTQCADSKNPCDSAGAEPLAVTIQGQGETNYPSLEWNWGILAFGMMASLCGLTLTGRAFFLNEADLWNVGFPILAGGASSLLVGILLQLDRLGRPASR